MVLIKRKREKYMELKKDCLSCANSFSESLEDTDVLRCMEYNEEIVDENGYCEDYN